MLPHADSDPAEPEPEPEPEPAVDFQAWLAAEIRGVHPSADTEVLVPYVCGLLEEGAEEEAELPALLADVLELEPAGAQAQSLAARVLSQRRKGAAPQPPTPGGAEAGGGGGGGGPPERRVDPSDGVAYEYASFVQVYAERAPMLWAKGTQTPNLLRQNSFHVHHLRGVPL